MRTLSLALTTQAAMPWAVEAFVFTDVPESPGAEGRAREAHAAFLSRYRLPVAQVPLLRVKPVERYWTPWAVEAFEDVS